MMSLQSIFSVNRAMLGSSIKKNNTMKASVAISWNPTVQNPQSIQKFNEMKQTKAGNLHSSEAETNRCLPTNIFNMIDYQNSCLSSLSNNDIYLSKGFQAIDPCFMKSCSDASSSVWKACIRIGEYTSLHTDPRPCHFPAATRTPVTCFFLI